MDPFPDVFLQESCFCCACSMFVFPSVRLLQSKPEAPWKALSENSLLKNIDFNEKFLGEETITESEMLLLLPLSLFRKAHY